MAEGGAWQKSQASESEAYPQMKQILQMFLMVFSNL
jgi:hypothetical protein